MTEKINFTKMEGLGNDYIYLDCIKNPIPSDLESLAKKVSDRHFGVGGDGLVLILPSNAGDFRMQMFNADGSEGLMCGNAARCVGKFLYERGHTNQETIKLETATGIKELGLELRNGLVDGVTVDLGEPILAGPQIPVLIEGEPIVKAPITVNDKSFEMTCVSVGNPHAIIFVEDLSDELVLTYGPQIEVNPIFPDRVNVEFVKIISPTEAEMRVWERGSGETLACGTGAGAVLIASVLNGFLERKATIQLLGGSLELDWREDNHLYKTGPARFVFDGEIEI